MGKKGDANNPQFELKNGTILELKRVPMLVLQRYRVEWQKSNPAPIPLQYRMTNGEWKPATFDETYQELRDNWKQLETDYTGQIIFKVGVASSPPDDWQPIYDIFADDLKLNWLYTIVDENEIEDLTIAILGLANATQAGLDAAQKN